MKIITFLALLGASYSFAQVGINTQTPKAIMHISESGDFPNKGLIIPNVSVAQARDMVLSNDQNSMMVYITAAATGTELLNPKIRYVYFPGYYFWSTTEQTWVSMLSPLRQAKVEMSILNGNNSFAGSGFRLVGDLIGEYRNFYLPLGSHATDVSYAYTGTPYTRGAGGDFSFAAGMMTVSSGHRSTALGGFNISSGGNSMSWGGAPGSTIGNTASGNGSTAFGRSNKATGDLSTVFGNSNEASAAFEVAFGFNSTKYVPQEASISYASVAIEPKINTDRILNIGSGATSSQPNDALTLLRNGKLGIGINNFEKTSSDSKLQVNGSVQVNAEALTLAGNTCNTSNLGKIIFAEDNFYGCKSTGWAQLNN